jgi:hypothetical protein
MRLARFALGLACNLIRFEIAMTASNTQFVFAGEGDDLAHDGDDDDLADGGGLHAVAATGNGLRAIAA